MAAPSLPDALALLRAVIEQSFPGFSPGSLVVQSTVAGHKDIQLPLIGAPPAPASSHEIARTSDEDWTPFKAKPFQKAILKALEGKAMRTCALGAAVGDRSRLFKPNGLKELQERGLVEHDDERGYYRPDSPPPGLEAPDED